MIIEIKVRKWNHSNSKIYLFIYEIFTICVQNLKDKSNIIRDLF